MVGEVRCALLGAGMYGGDVVLRTIADLELAGLAPFLGPVGLDRFGRDLAGMKFSLCAIGTRSRSSAEKAAARYRAWVGGSAVKPYWGEKPWEALLEECRPHILFVATPDHLHCEPTLAALQAGAHVVVEKPLCLSLAEADQIVEKARSSGLIVGVDMHKRYDPCHVFLFTELVPRLGTLNYGYAVLEEPLEVSASTFAWAERSNPFCYVGVHWVDLFQYYLKVKPLSLHAVGQKHLLKTCRPKPIDTFDSMQVSVQYDSGLNVQYVNAWINPPDFEGPVNQEMRIVGVRGVIEFDQQDRGLRAAITGEGSRTYNPHFMHSMRRFRHPTPTSLGYGKDSLIACTAACALVLAGRKAASDLTGAYPAAREAREQVGVIQAATAVAERNWKYFSDRSAAPVTAHFDNEGITLLDPFAGEEKLYSGCPWFQPE